MVVGRCRPSVEISKRKVGRRHWGMECGILVDDDVKNAESLAKIDSTHFLLTPSLQRIRATLRALVTMADGP